MIKSTIRYAFAQLGYGIVRIPKEKKSAETAANVIGPTDPDSRVASTLPLSECYAVFKTVCPIFQPWLGYGEFGKVFQGVEAKTLVSADRCYLLWKFANLAKVLRRDVIECGVYRGGTALLLARTIHGSGRKLWLFDSYEGLPNPKEEKGDFYKRGSFGDTTFEAVAELLRPFAGDIEMKKGWIPESFAGLAHLEFSLAHVDVDLYDPALECCRFIWPRLVRGAVMLFDDYGFPACRGERTAVDAFFADKETPVIVLPSGQGLVIKP